MAMIPPMLSPASANFCGQAIRMSEAISSTRSPRVAQATITLRSRLSLSSWGP